MSLLEKAYIIKLQQWNSDSSAITQVMGFQNWSVFWSALHKGMQELFSCAQNSNWSEGCIIAGASFYRDRAPEAQEAFKL